MRALARSGRTGREMDFGKREMAGLETRDGKKRRAAALGSGNFPM